MEVKVIPFKQDATNMYVGVMRIDDILKLAHVDVWRSEEGQESGYQRQPETGRARKVARYLRTSVKPLMPLTVLLGLRREADVHSEADGSLSLILTDDDVLWEVDGQHRLAGFRRVIEEDGVERFRDYILPVVIMEGSSMESEAEQFRIINETMKKVRTDLARRILAMMGRSLAGRREIISVGRGWEATSVDILNILNTDRDSPWYGRIQPPNTRKQASHTIRDASFSTSLKPVLTQRPFRDWRTERIADTLCEYWKAWQELVPDAFDHADDYVLLKTPGVFSLHELAYYVFEACRTRGKDNPNKDDFIEILRHLDEYVSPEFWARDNFQGAAAAGSMKGFGILYDMMKEALIDAGYTID